MIVNKLPTFDPQTSDDCIDSRFVFEMIPADDEIISCSITVSPNDLVVESFSFAGNEVVGWFAHGTDGITYTVQVDVSTAAGRTFCRCALIPVEPPDGTVLAPAIVPSTERVTTGASPISADNRIALTSITSGGTAGQEHIILPDFAFTPELIGTRHNFVLATQTDPSDSVRVFTGTDNSSVSAYDVAGNYVAQIASGGVVLDYEGAYVSFEWQGSFWSLRNEAGQTDTAFSGLGYVPFGASDGIAAFLCTNGAGGTPLWRPLMAAGSYGAVRTGASPVSAAIAAGATLIITGGTGGTEIVNVLAPQSAFPFAVGARHVIGMTTHTASGDVVSISPVNIKASNGSTLTSIRLLAANKFVVLEAVDLNTWHVIFSDASLA